MNIEQIDSKITFNTGASLTDFLPADRLIAINNAVDNVHIMILQAQDGDDFDDKNYTSNFPVYTTNLVADQPDYSLPSEYSNFKRATAKYDGENDLKVTPFDIGETGEAIKTDSFSSTSPFYDLHDNSIELYPTPTATVEDGLRIWISRTMALFTTEQVDDGAKEPGFDRQFHELIPLKVSWDWYFYKVMDYAKADRLQNAIDRLEVKLKKHYGSKEKDTKQSFGASVVDYS